MRTQRTRSLNHQQASETAMPPKKDAFADLFPSSTNSKGKQSLGEMLRTNSNLPLLSIQVQKSSDPFDFDLLSGKSSPATSSVSVMGNANLQKESNSSMDPFSVLSPQPRSSGPNSQRASPSPSVGMPATTLKDTTKQANINSKAQNSDPFDIFNETTVPVPLKLTRHSSTANSSTTAQSDINLLDDIFTDAYVENATSKPKIESQSAPRGLKIPETKRSESTSQVKSKDLARDEVLAELLEIGFPVEIANNAINEVGLEVQQCVNFIMDGGKKSTAKPVKKQHQELNELNELASEMFSKASFFFNKSKKTVLKNLEQFQHPKGDPDTPAWMRNQSKYMEWLPEGESKAHRSAEELRLRLETENYDMMRQRGSSRQSESSNTLERQVKPQQNFFEEEVNQVNKGPTPAKEANNTSPEPRRIPRASKPIESVDLLGLSKKTEQTLDQFRQTDYDRYKKVASDSFSNGDYDMALTNYKRCLEILPEDFELRIVVFSNLALTCIKIGNYKQARSHCTDGLSMISTNMIKDINHTVQGKLAKSWYIKLLLRRAESLEQSEAYADSLKDYLELVKMGVNDKKIMDGKRRVDKIVNPQKTKPPVPKSNTNGSSGGNKKPTRPIVPSANAEEKTKQVRDQFNKEKQEEEAKFQIHDQVQAKVDAWSNGKETNLRALLIALPDIIPSHLDFAFMKKPITVNDLMLSKKVKISYMKVISAIHPDKLSKLQLEEKMICQTVFITLNKAWDHFKEQELA